MGILLMCTEAESRRTLTAADPSVPVSDLYFQEILICFISLFLSISLKILLCSFRWNVVGFQGSLLSYFTEPIYFSSIILGSLYHADHLSRAMYQRITEIEELPQSFSLNRPLLSGERHCSFPQFTDFSDLFIRTWLFWESETRSCSQILWKIPKPRDIIFVLIFNIWKVAN